MEDNHKGSIFSDFAVKLILKKKLGTNLGLKRTNYTVVLLWMRKVNRRRQSGRERLKQITGGTKSPRKRSASTLRKKARVEREPFSIVYCDGFEGAVGGAAESYSRHQYILRFVCGSTGYQKSFSCLTKDRFVDAFRMFQA